MSSSMNEHCPTYRYFIHGYIYNTANHYNEVKQIPSIYKVVLQKRDTSKLAPSCVLVGVLTRERVSGACFRSKLPRVYRP